ncbi:MAG: arylamine N-acetyltransferase [Acidobacteriota bacterium]|nr:arylamine N-acetyltransferase [Acidobacteriota bacterium]
MHVNRYLQHLGYSGPREPNARTLAALQTAHLHRVPFENLSIHSGETIHLDPNAFFQKIVGRNRGGFCYELNGLFGELLRELGFQVSLYSAGVAGADGSFGPLHDHMFLRVDLPDGPRLADVGFGENFRTPMRLVMDAVHREDLMDHRLLRTEAGIVLQKRKPGGDWQPSFRFPEQAWRLPDFTGMCRHHQTSPQSSFTQRLTCSLARPGGRITLSAGSLIETRGDVRAETPITEADHWGELLREHFGMEVPDGLRFPEPEE